MPGHTKLKGERVNFALQFQGDVVHHDRTAGGSVVTWHVHLLSRERTGNACPAPGDTLHPLRLHRSKVPQSPDSELAAGDQ